MTARALLLAATLAAPLAHADDVGVFIRFGFKDTAPTIWDGSVTSSAGKVVSVEGWRFEGQDKVTEAAAWKASTRTLTARKKRGNNPAKLGQRQAQVKEPMADNGVIVQLSEVNADTQVSVKTAQGRFCIPTGGHRAGQAATGAGWQGRGGACRIHDAGDAGRQQRR